MKLKSQTLNQETQLLVGVSAAVASGCVQCLEKMAELAQNAGIDPNKIKESAMIGQFVKDKPTYHMKEAADKLLGTHLLKFRTLSDCPIDEQKEKAVHCDLNKKNESCGCNT